MLQTDKSLMLIGLSLIFCSFHLQSNNLWVFVDIALKILEHHKREVAQARSLNALHVLARKPIQFSGGRRKLISGHLSIKVSVNL